MDEEPKPESDKTKTEGEGGEAKGPPPVPEEVKLGGGDGENSGLAIHEVIWDNLKLFSRRIVRGKSAGDGITGDERAELEGAEVTAPMTQNYLAWRRAPLWFGTVALGISVLFGLISYFSEGGAMPTGTIASLTVILTMVAEVGACVLAYFAATGWAAISKTRRFSRFAWLLFFAVPALLFLIPTGNAAIGFVYLLMLTPKLIGVFPGLVRASLSLKGLLPESPMPGWTALIVAPIYAVFFAVLLVVAIQLGEGLLIISVAALVTAAVFVIVNAKRLADPCGEEEASKVIGPARLRVGIAHGIGLVAAILYGIQMIDSLGFLSVASILFGILASVFLLTVVAADLLIGVSNAAFVSENALREGVLHGTLAGRFEELEGSGLTSLLAGEAELVRSVKEKVSGDGEKDEGDKTEEETPGEGEEKEKSE